MAGEIGREAGCDTGGPVQKVVTVTPGKSDDEDTPDEGGGWRLRFEWPRGAERSAHSGGSPQNLALVRPPGQVWWGSETVPRFLAGAPPPPPHLPNVRLHLPSQLVKDIECRQPSGHTIAALMLFLFSQTWR